MLIHIAPRCHSPRLRDISLISVEIPELSIALHEGKELLARRPYPNKDYLVANAKSDRAAKDGFFLEAYDQLAEFRVVTTWAVNADRTATSNHSFTILDPDCEATSSDPVVWLGMYEKWDSRWPEQVPDTAPVNITPTLHLDHDDSPLISPTHFVLPGLAREHVVDCAGAMLPGNRHPDPQHSFRQGEL